MVAATIRPPTPINKRCRRIELPLPRFGSEPFGLCRDSWSSNSCVPFPHERRARIRASSERKSRPVLPENVRGAYDRRPRNARKEAGGFFEPGPRVTDVRTPSRARSGGSGGGGAELAANGAVEV